MTKNIPTSPSKDYTPFLITYQFFNILLENTKHVNDLHDLIIALRKDCLSFKNTYKAVTLLQEHQFNTWVKKHSKSSQFGPQISATLLTINTLIGMIQECNS